MDYPVPAHAPKEVLEWATYYVPSDPKRIFKTAPTPDGA